MRRPQCRTGTAGGDEDPEAQRRGASGPNNRAVFGSRTIARFAPGSDVQKQQREFPEVQHAETDTYEVGIEARIRPVEASQPMPRPSTLRVREPEQPHPPLSRPQPMRRRKALRMCTLPASWWRHTPISPIRLCPLHGQLLRAESRSVCLIWDEAAMKRISPLLLPPPAPPWSQQGNEIAQGAAWPDDAPAGLLS